MKYAEKRHGITLLLLPAIIAAAGCYAPPQTRSAGVRFNPPAIALPQLGKTIDLDALRTSWDAYPMGYNHTRIRNQGSGKGKAMITAYRGISSIGPNSPPSGTVLFAHIRNFGPGTDNRYNLKPQNAAEYYVIVDKNPADPTVSRWRMLEVPRAPMGTVSFVQQGGVEVSGKLHQCPNHYPRLVEEADFWKCEDGDGDHVTGFSILTALASAGSMPVGREFWSNVFKSTSARSVNGGDEYAWASCSGGCCTLEY